MKTRMFGSALAILALTACAGPSGARNVRLTPEEERILRPIPDPPDRVRRLVEQGDEMFLQGIPPYRRIDPESNPDWTSQVTSALDCYTRARSSYLAAQGEFPSPQPVPPPLLDRVRECVLRIAALQKQRHAGPPK